MNEDRVDLDLGTVLRLHTRARMQDEDLYTFLERELPDLSPEERLKYLAAILNDYFDEYEHLPGEEIRRDGYLIQRFVPKKGESDGP